jgi:hypothetical protein
MTSWCWSLATRFLFSAQIECSMFSSNGVLIKSCLVLDRRVMEFGDEWLLNGVRQRGV